MISIKSFIEYQEGQYTLLEEAEMPIVANKRDEIYGSFDFVVDGKKLLSREMTGYLDWNWCEILNAMETLVDPSIHVYSLQEVTDDYHRVRFGYYCNNTELDFVLWSAEDRDDERIEVVCRDLATGKEDSASLPAREFYDAILNGAELFFKKMKKLAPRKDFSQQLETIDRIDRREMHYPPENINKKGPWLYYLPGDDVEEWDLGF